MSHVLRVGVTDQIAYFRAFNTDGSGKTDLTSATAGLSLSVFRVGLAAVSIASLSSKAADSTTHADGAIRAVAGNLYTVDLPDAATADQTPSVGVKGTYTEGVIEPVPHPIVNYDPAAAAVGALTTLGTNAPASWINEAAIADGAITNAKLADGAISVGKIADNSITAAKIADETLTASKFSTALSGLWTNLIAMITGSGVTAAYTAKALENGPGGAGGGLATVENQEAILAAIQGTEVIQVASPNVLGNLVLTQGDTYDGIGNPKAQWTVSTDYTVGWTVTFTIRDENDVVIYTVAGAVASATLVTVAIVAPTGLAFSGCPGVWQGKFDVQLTKAGSVQTIALGKVFINEDQTR